MKKEEKTALTVSFIGLVLFVSLLTYGLFGYELGLKKPKYHKGDCVRLNLSDEFKVLYSYYLITAIGKNEYNTLEYYYIDKKATSSSYDYSGRGFQQVDNDYEKIDCPKNIEIIQ